MWTAWHFEANIWLTMLMTHCLSVQRSQGLRSGGLGGPGGASFSSCAARNCLRGGEQREGWATPSLSSDQGFLLKVQLASVKLPFKWIAVHWHCSSKCKFFVYFKEVFLSSFCKHMFHPSRLYTCQWNVLCSFIELVRGSGQVCICVMHQPGQAGLAVWAWCLYTSLTFINRGFPEHRKKGTGHRDTRIGSVQRKVCARTQIQHYVRVGVRAAAAFQLGVSWAASCSEKQRLKCRALLGDLRLCSVSVIMDNEIRSFGETWDIVIHNFNPIN